MTKHVSAPHADHRSSPKTVLPRPNVPDALEWSGTPRCFARHEEVYAEGEVSDCWYQVAHGTVRISKLLVDGRRHIAEFCFAGDCFGLESGGHRTFSAEAVGKVILMRYPHQAIQRMIDQDPGLARCVYAMTLEELAHLRARMLMLGRMTASERVASFLLEMSSRSDSRSVLDLPMSRVDVADYLGLTVETVSRTLSAFKRAGSIAIPNTHRVEVRDREALEAIAEGAGPARTELLPMLRLPGLSASPRASLPFA